MAKQDRIENDPTLIGNSQPRADESRDTEHDRVRSSNDRDQQMEREGVQTDHNRGYDQAVRGERQPDVDPDSPDAQVDRDDLDNG